jgi:hypothetical protein
VKKLLTALCLALVLCLLCGAAFATDTTETTGADGHVHDWKIEADKSKVITWPTKGHEQEGRIEFVCSNAGEYVEADASEFLRLQILPTPHDLPETVEDALALKDTERCLEYVAPTCTEDGSITIKCGSHNEDTEDLTYDEVWFRGWKGDCDEKVTFTLKAEGHKWSNDPQWEDLRESEGNLPMYHYYKEPTCTEEGELHVYCLVCGDENGEIVYPEALGHVKPEEGDEDHIIVTVVTDAPDCMNPGLETTTTEYLCTRCNTKIDEWTEVEEKELDADPHAHVFGDWVVLEKESKHATCTEDGQLVERRICKVCLDAKEIRTETEEALGHDFSVEVSKKAATCKEAGEVVKKCSRCEETETTELPIDPKAHPLEYWQETDESTEPTCEEDGKICYKCQLCGAEGFKTLEKLGHDWKVVDNAEEAKCAKDDKDAVDLVTKKVCKRAGCDAEEVLSTVKVEHVWSEYVCEIEFNQDGKDTPAYWIRQCTVCGKPDEIKLNSAADPNKEGEEPEEPACEHEYEEEPVSAPDCIHDGEVKFTCTKCGDTYSEVIPALGEDGHEWDDGEITTEATPSASGVKTYTCTICGDTYTEEVPFEFGETPVYEFGEVSYIGKAVVGNVIHDETTVEAKRLYVRLTIFFVDGTYAIVRDIVEDGQINVPVYGNVDSIGVELIGASDSLNPGEYDMYDVYPLQIL